MVEQKVGAKHAAWYEESNDLLQGTIIRAVRVFEEADESTAGALKVADANLDLIVLTQSCDIVNGSMPRLLTAEVQGWLETVPGRSFMNKKDEESYRKKLVRNLAISDWLIPPCALLGLDDYMVVNFRELHMVRKDRLPQSDRYVCLTSPFREQLSQTFATYIMRVGLPTPPLSEFERYTGS